MGIVPPPILKPRGKNTGTTSNPIDLEESGQGGLADRLRSLREKTQSRRVTFDATAKEPKLSRGRRQTTSKGGVPPVLTDIGYAAGLNLGKVKTEPIPVDSDAENL